MNKKIKEIKINEINNQININPRLQLSEENIQKLIDVPSFPPIEVGLHPEYGHVVIDGEHRMESLLRKGEEKVEAYITKYDSLWDMKIEAIKKNIHHGIKLKEEEILKALKERINYLKKKGIEYTLKDVGQEIGLSYRETYSFIKMLRIEEVLKKEFQNVNLNRSQAEILGSLFLEKEKYKKPIAQTKKKLIDFWSKYKSLTRKELRKAKKLYLEGKDFFEEKQKEIEKKTQELMKEKKENKEDEILDEKDVEELTKQIENSIEEEEIKVAVDYSELLKKIYKTLEKNYQAIDNMNRQGNLIMKTDANRTLSNIEEIIDGFSDIYTLLKKNKNADK